LLIVSVVKLVALTPVSGYLRFSPVFLTSWIPQAKFPSCSSTSLEGDVAAASFQAHRARSDSYRCISLRVYLVHEQPCFSVGQTGHRPRQVRVCCGPSLSRRRPPSDRLR
jgi:hypothetical protein